MYGSETIIWKENERSRIRAVQMDDLRGLLGIRRIDKAPNILIRHLCRVMKGVDEKIDGVLQWFSLVKRMENRIAKRVYVVSYIIVLLYVGRNSVDRPWMRWIDNIKICLKC